jgi:hypothetical protein
MARLPGMGMEGTLVLKQLMAYRLFVMLLIIKGNDL